jgi:hypothetical protein
MRTSRASARLSHAAPWALLLALVATWVLWYPPSPDLAAQVFRVHLFEADGFSLWDNSWYGGHYLPSYSLLLPALGAFAGLRAIGVCSALLSVWAFSRLVRRFGLVRPDAARAAFALSVVGDLFIGRIAFALGVAIGLLAVDASTRGLRGSRALGGSLSLACAAASPVAAVFLALAACADWAVNRRTARALALGGPALALTAAFAVLLPEGGYEPFAASSLLAAGGASLCVLLLAPPAQRLLRVTFALYLLVLLGCYLVPSPVGSNAVRFGVLFAPAMLVGCVTIADVQARAASLVSLVARARRVRAHRGFELGRRVASPLLAGCIALMVGWQLTGPLSQSVGASLSPSSRASFYAPVIGYLQRAARGRPIRVEVPFTSSHWDADVLGAHFMLARGWERQLDTHYDELFYGPRLTASAYRAWLLTNGVSYVALSDAPLDFSSVQEAALIRAGLPFLRLAEQTRHWRIYEVRGAQALASGPGSLQALNGDGFSIAARRPGRYLVRVHYTPYWSVVSGSATLGPAPGDWTELHVRHSGTIAVDAEFSLGALSDAG